MIKKQNPITYHDIVAILLAFVMYLWHTMTSTEGAAQIKNYRKIYIGNYT